MQNLLLQRDSFGAPFGSLRHTQKSYKGLRKSLHQSFKKKPIRHFLFSYFLFLFGLVDTLISLLHIYLFWTNSECISQNTQM